MASEPKKPKKKNVTSGRQAQRCHAHASDGSGRQCRAYAMNGQKVCCKHGGMAPNARNAAAMRLLAAADPAAAELVRLAKSAKNEHVRLRACDSILDRTDNKTPDKLLLAGHDGGPLPGNLNLSGLSTEQIEQLAAILGRALEHQDEGPGASALDRG
jgi:hypothetical protein